MQEQKTAEELTKDLRLVFQRGHTYNLTKGQYINLFDEERVYFIQEGFVKRYLITKEGGSSVQAIYEEDQIFPLTTLIKTLVQVNISNEQKTYFYQTLSSALLYSLPIATLKDNVSQDSSLYPAILVQAAKRLRSNIQQLDNSALKSARWRLAHQLVYLAQQYGQVTEDGVSIALPLTQVELSAMLNINRETTSRVLGRMQTQGYISHYRRQLIVPSIERLQSVYM